VKWGWLLVWFLVFLGSAASSAASLPKLGESLEYTLKYRGLFSGYVELDIAKLTLQVEQKMGQVADQATYVTHMQLTTEPYAKAEMLYPVRLSYRSWLDASKLHPLVAFKSLQTGDAREELFWFDRRSGYAYHYKSADQEEDVTHIPPMKLRTFTPLSTQQWRELNQTQAIEMAGVDALDYMGLLHRLRYMPLKSGKIINFATFNGKEIEWFRVAVRQDRLLRAGWDRSVYRLTLHEVDPDNGDLGDEIQLWMSDDEQRLLLRFYAERSFGSMEGILETGRPMVAQQKEPLSEATQSSIKTYLDF
jgi:hypothetical protein